MLIAPQWRRWSALARAIGLITVARVAAIVVALMILTVAAFQPGRVDDAGGVAAAAAGTVDPLAVDLARCRTISAEQLANDGTCRRVWAENRRRFFAPSRSEAR